MFIASCLAFQVFARLRWKAASLVAYPKALASLYATQWGRGSKTLHTCCLFFFSPQRGAIRFDKTKWEWLRKRKKMKERRQGKPGKQNEALSFFRNQKPSFLTFFLLFSKSVLSFRRVSSPPPFQASAPLCLCAGGKKSKPKSKPTLSPS